jgi:hypothetical protein
MLLREHRSHLKLPGCPGTLGEVACVALVLTTLDGLVDTLPGVALRLGAATGLFSSEVAAVVTTAAPAWAEQQLGKGRELS